MFYRSLIVLSSILIGLISNAELSKSEDSYAGISNELPTGSPTISESGLVAAYDFETYTSDGLLRDFGPFKNHGEVERTNTTAGLFGKARVFSEVTDRVDLPERGCFDIDGPLSIAVWVQITTHDLHQHIIACDDKFVLWVTDKNQFRLADTRGQGFSTREGSVQSGDWHSLVAVLYGTRSDLLSKDTIRIFVDGKSIDGTYEGKWTPTVLYPPDACYIGFESHQDSKGHRRLKFEGIIDEMLIFSRPLTKDEIQAHASRPPS
jgi:hypothetical protein